MPEHWSVCHALFQGIFPTQELNPCLLRLRYCRQILYHWATKKAQVSLGKYKMCNPRMKPVLLQSMPSGIHLNARSSSSDVLPPVFSLSWFCQPVPSFLFLLQLVHAFDCPTFPADTFLCVWIWASTLYVSIPFWVSLWNSPTLRIWLSVTTQFGPVLLNKDLTSHCLNSHWLSRDGCLCPQFWSLNKV